MSAITGICDLRAISGSASASSWDGTATRTIWQPAAVSSAICCSVLFTSAVTVVVIDWTETGAPPPTGTACVPLPTITWRDVRRVARGAGGAAGIPRSIFITESASLTWMRRVEASLDKMHRVEDVRRHQQHAEPDQQREHADADRDQPLQVGQARVRPAAQPGKPGPDLLINDNSEVAAVQREQRQEVERADEDVERDDDQQQVGDDDPPPAARRDRLAR